MCKGLVAFKREVGGILHLSKGGLHVAKEKQCPPVKEKMSGGEGVNFLQAPTSFPQAPSYFKHSQKDVEGGGPGKKDVGPPPWISFKKGSCFCICFNPAQGSTVLGASLKLVYHP